MKWLILVTTLWIASCAPGLSPFCDVASPMRPDPATLDVMTRSEKEQMLAHNRKGAELCGWTPEVSDTPVRSWWGLW